MKELVLEAKDENLNEVLAFVEACLEEKECSMKVQLQMDMIVEEIFVNIAHYAYLPDVGMAKIQVDFMENPLSVMITFYDNGIPYDPLAKEDPDITLSAEERQIGGLGIYMVKKSVDDIHYEYKNGQNILCIRKNI